MDCIFTSLISFQMVSSLEQLPVVKVASAQAYISATKGSTPNLSDIDFGQ
jgi:hypothetical protein